MKTFVLLILILSLCALPIKSYAGGGAGPHGNYDSSNNSELETGVWVVLMVGIGAGLYSALNKGKALEQTTHGDLPEMDVLMEGFLCSNAPNITPIGEFIVFRW